MFLFWCQVVSIVKFTFFLLLAEPVTEIIGGSDLFINKGSTINLTCVVRYAPEPPPSMVWSHNREVSVNMIQGIKSEVFKLNFLETNLILK